MDGVAALLVGLGGLTTALTGLLVVLRPRKPEPEDDDDVAAWRDRALLAEQRAERYEQLWLDCQRSRGAPAPRRP